MANNIKARVRTLASAFLNLELASVIVAVLLTVIVAVLLAVVAVLAVRVVVVLAAAVIYLALFVVSVVGILHCISP